MQRRQCGGEKRKIGCMYGQACPGRNMLHMRSVYRYIGPRRPKVELALFVIINPSISASGERGRSGPRSTTAGDHIR